MDLVFFGKKQDDAQDNPRRPSSPSGENRSRHTDDSLVQTVMQEGLPGGLPLPPAPAAPPLSPKEPQVQQAAPEPSPEKGDKPGRVGKLIRLCTYLGLKLLRRAKQAQRRARRYTVRLGDSLTREKDVLRDNLAERTHRLSHYALEPLTRDREILSGALESLESAKGQGYQRRLSASLAALIGLFTFLGRFLRRSLNYVCPLAALLLLFSTISYYNRVTYGVIVEYGGTELGLVASEDDYDRAEEILQSRIVYDDESEKVVSTPSFTLTRVADGTVFSTPEELCDNLISASGQVVQELSGLYINGQFYGAVEDGDSLQRYLDGLLRAQGTGQPGETLKFSDNVVIRSGLYPVSSAVPLSDLCSRIGHKRGSDRSYTVEEGDTLLSIAQKSRVSLVTLQTLNDDITDEELQPGQVIRISRALPFLPVSVTTQETYTEVIPHEVYEVEDARLSVGHSSLLTEGEDGERVVTAQVERVNGVEVTRIITNVEITKPAVAEERTVGSNAGSYSASSQDEPVDIGMTFLWPSANGYLSCGIWEYSGHTGADLAGPEGTNIYAAESGTVEIAKTSGWNGGYGQYVAINHGNNVITLYAHCSAVYVSPGDTVRKGDVIAAVGQTGNASGNHVHFEVRKNGVFLDPTDYLESVRWTK